MTEKEPRSLAGTEAAHFPQEVQSALLQMAQACDYSRELECDLWEFAVEIERLLAIGLTTSDLRFLVKKGFAAHAREITAPHDTARVFQADSNLAFSAATCFVLTPAGMALLQPTPAPDLLLRLSEDGAAMDASSLVPSWDGNTRTLCFGGQIVKQYRVPSPNQEAVLDAFQEEGWPHAIDDPLSPISDQSPKQRLRDTIRCLNLSQTVQVIRFRGDGTGQRVCWELVDDQAVPFDLPPHDLRKTA